MIMIYAIPGSGFKSTVAPLGLLSAKWEYFAYFAYFAYDFHANRRSERRQRPRDLVVPPLLLPLGQLAVGTHDWRRGRRWWWLGVFVWFFGCLWWSRLKDGSGLFEFVSGDFFCWRRSAVAWSLPPACDEKYIVSDVDNCKSNQIEHISMNTKPID